MPADSVIDPPAALPAAAEEIFALRDRPWVVAHTRPRCEKKLLAWCERERVAATLPCYQTAHKYRGKTVTFEKPLFPGYLFARPDPARLTLLRQNDQVANLLTVADQAELEAQLRDILRALAARVAVRLAPHIGKGMRVRIKSGALRGVEGWVEERYGMDTVLLRLDFIGQAAAITLGADALELV